ncbi:MAG: hypothetical protein EOP14_04040, partial [Pseudomonas sp.]
MKKLFAILALALVSAAAFAASPPSDSDCCDEVVMTPFGILRFSEKLGENAAHDNSHPARFVHVDMAREPAAGMREKTAPAAPEGKA